MSQEPGRKSSRTMRSEAASPQAGRPESQRRGDSVRGGVAGPRGGGGGRFLAVFLVVIVLLVAVCATLYVAKTRKEARILKQIQEEQEKTAANRERAYQCFMKAHQAGANFVTSRDPNVTDDQLFGLFRSDDKTYNVVYTRNYKDRGQSRFVQKMMDPNRKSIQEFGNPFVRDNVQIKTGKLDDDTPIMTARRTYAPDPGNTISEGGEILVIVYAVK
jgi:hypothetical protein